MTDDEKGDGQSVEDYLAGLDERPREALRALVKSTLRQLVSDFLVSE